MAAHKRPNYFRLLLISVNVLVVLFVFKIPLSIGALQKSTPFVTNYLFFTFPFGEAPMPSALFYVLLLMIIVPTSTVGCVVAFLKYHKYRALSNSFYIFQLALGIALFSMKDHSENRFELEVTLIEAIMQYSVKHNKNEAAQWDATHRNFKCCGFDGYRDWFVTPYGDRTDVPNSCCLKPNSRCGKNASHVEGIESQLFARGCYPIIINKLDHIRFIYLSVIFVLVCTPLIVWIQNVWSLKKVRRRQED